VHPTGGGPLVQKPLLVDVSGYVRPGTMLALMGLIISFSVSHPPTVVYRQLWSWQDDSADSVCTVSLVIDPLNASTVSAID
jgi:hypothetical protein